MGTFIIVVFRKDWDTWCGSAIRLSPNEAELPDCHECHEAELQSLTELQPLTELGDSQANVEASSDLPYFFDSHREPQIRSLATLQRLRNSSETTSRSNLIM